MKIVIEEARAFVNADKSGIGKFYLNTMDMLSSMGYSPICFEKKFLIKLNPILRRILYFIWLNTVFIFKLLMLRDKVIVVGVSYYVPFFKIPNVYYLPVIHDLTAVEYPEIIPKWNAFVIKIITENAIRNGDRIITVSETSKSAISEKYGFPSDKIFNVFSSLSLNSMISIDEEKVLEKYGISEKKYFLSVSSFSPHKNIKSLIIAYKQIEKDYPNYKLVLVGKGMTEEECKKVQANSKVIFTGFIDEEELKVLYKNSAIYIFPSLIEGFGLPIIDAQQFKVPIICSDIPVFREVASQNGALFCEPTSDEIAKNIKGLLSDNNKIDELVNNGYKNINRFSDDIRKKLWKEALEINTNV